MLNSDMKQSNVWPYSYTSDSCSQTHGNAQYHIEKTQKGDYVNTDNILSRQDKYDIEDGIFPKYMPQSSSACITDILHDNNAQNISSDSTNVTAKEKYKNYLDNGMNYDNNKTITSNVKYGHEYDTCAEYSNENFRDLTTGSIFDNADDNNTANLDTTSRLYEANSVNVRWNDNYKAIAQENINPACNYLTNDTSPGYEKSANGFSSEANLRKVDAYINKTFQNHFNNYIMGNGQCDNFRENFNLTQLFGASQNNYPAYDPNPQYVWNNNIGLGFNSNMSATGFWGNSWLGNTCNAGNPINNQHSTQTIGSNNRIDLYDMTHNPYGTGYLVDTMGNDGYCNMGQYPNQHDYSSGSTRIPSSRNITHGAAISEVYPTIDSNSLGDSMNEFDFYNKCQSQYIHPSLQHQGYYDSQVQKPMQKHGSKRANHSEMSLPQAESEEALEGVLYRGNLKKMDLTNIDFIGMSDKLWQTLKGAGMFKLGNKGRAILKSKISKHLKMHPEIRMRAGCISGVRRATTRQLFQLAQICQITSHLK